MVAVAIVTEQKQHYWHINLISSSHIGITWPVKPMYRDSGSLWQAENQSLREKLLRLGHSPAELQGTASENIIEEASDSIVGKPIISFTIWDCWKTTHLSVDFTTRNGFGDGLFLSLPWFTTLKLQTLPLFWARGPWGLVPRIDSPKQVTTRRGALSVLLRRRRHEGWQQPQHLMCWTWSFYDQYIYIWYII